MRGRPPLWLPTRATLAGDLRQNIARLYQIFCADFKNSPCEFQGRPIVWDTRLVPGESYEEGFWHLISRESTGTNLRHFDPDRAGRLPWCAPMIKNAYDSAVKVWDYRKTARLIRTYVWLEQWDYVVVLQKRTSQSGPIAVLISAYHVDGPWTRRQLSTMYAKRT